MQQIQLNIISFTPPVKEITLPFYLCKQEGYYGLFLDEEVWALGDDKMTTLELIENKWIYTDFGKPQKDVIVVIINAVQHPNIQLHYFRHLLHKHFPPLSGVSPPDHLQHYIKDQAVPAIEIGIRLLTANRIIPRLFPASITFNSPLHSTNISLPNLVIGNRYMN